MIAALLLLTATPTSAAAQASEPGLFYLEPAKTNSPSTAERPKDASRANCRWMLLSLKRRSKTLCRNKCAAATLVFAHRGDEMGDLQVSRSGDYAWVRYQSELVVFADAAGSRPILRVRGHAFETWVALARP